MEKWVCAALMLLNTNTDTINTRARKARAALTRALSSLSSLAFPILRRNYGIGGQRRNIERNRRSEPTSPIAETLFVRPMMIPDERCVYPGKKCFSTALSPI